MRPAQAVEAARSVIGEKRVRLHEPLFIGNERAYLDDALASGQVAYGPYVQRFEEKLCEITGRKHAVATSSGTAALHLAIGVMSGFETREDERPCEFSMPSLTFVATANAVQYCGMTPSFTEGPAYLSVDVLGRVNRWERADVGWPGIEDAAPALGSDGAGTFGRLACFSFNGNKIVTCGGGGAVVTDEQSLAEQIRHLANQAKSSPTEHDQVGFNYRMPNLNAALGLAQLERLPEFLERKARLADRYAQVFGEHFWKPPEGSNNWLNAILVDNRDEVVSALNEAGYESRPLHAPLHTLPMYRDCPRGDMARTMEIWRRCVCLPSGAGLA